MHPKLKKGVKVERWGEPFQDRRDWKVYNRQLVGRGELLIHPTFFQRWAHDIEQANHGKEGAPFEYPEALLQYLAFVRTRTKGLDYRSLQGFAHALIEGAKPGLRIWGMKDEELPPEMRDHAWFVGFAPRDNPRVSFAVIVEHGGHGGTAAAPIVKRVLEKYFESEARSAPEQPSPPRQVADVGQTSSGTL